MYEFFRFPVIQQDKWGHGRLIFKFYILYTSTHTLTHTHTHTVGGKTPLNE